MDSTKQIGKHIMNNIQYTVMPPHSKSVRRRNKHAYFFLSLSEKFHVPAHLLTLKAFAINIRYAPEPMPT